MHRKRIIVIGGGFAGLNFIKRIDRKRFDVTVVDTNNYHSFPPLFYQLASAGLDAASINFPLRREMRTRHAKGCRYKIGTVSHIDVGNHTVHTQFESIEYDMLVIAAGSTNNFFGIKDLDKRVNTIKTTPEAIRCRNDMLTRLERAAVCTDPEQRRRMLTFTVVGGGPAGVEVAGALGEMKRYIVPREYPGIDRDEVTINLIEGSDTILGFLPEKLRHKAAQSLERLMVNVYTSRTLKEYDNNIITFTDPAIEPLYTESLIWTAGVTGCSFRLTGTDIAPGRGNRFVVDKYNRVEGIPDMFAIGDISLHTDEKYPHGAPQLAQAAIQQGRTLARNLNCGEWRYAFSYHDKGTMATIGRNRAVASIGRFNFSGYFAWLTWMMVHLITLMGMRNRIVVLINWIWAYFSFSSSLRLIMRQARLPLRHPED